MICFDNQDEEKYLPGNTGLSFGFNWNCYRFIDILTPPPPTPPPRYAILYNSTSLMLYLYIYLDKQCTFIFVLIISVPLYFIIIAPLYLSG